MYKYRAIYFYRNELPDKSLDLTNPDNWDGQEMLDFTTPEEIGSLDSDSVKDQIDYVTAQIGKHSGHPIISLVSMKQGFDEGKSLLGNGES